MRKKYKKRKRGNYENKEEVQKKNNVDVVCRKIKFALQIYIKKKE